MLRIWGLVLAQNIAGILQKLNLKLVVLAKNYLHVQQASVPMGKQSSLTLYLIHNIITSLEKIDRVWWFENLPNKGNIIRRNEPNISSVQFFILDFLVCFCLFYNDLLSSTRLALWLYFVKSRDSLLKSICYTNNACMN